MTDTYHKYLKYKAKYLAMKEGNKIDNSENYILKLKKLYPQCIHDNGSLKNNKAYEKYATTYGEMDYPAIELFSKKYNNMDYFIDFGSGRGKLPLFMATSVKKSIGIELVSERHQCAVELKNQLEKFYPEITSKVSLIEGDMFEYLAITTFDKPAIIWISNLCFPESITKDLFNAISIKFKAGTIIGCSKFPNDIPTNITKIEEMTVPMSWNKNSTIHIFCVK